ncbi:Myb/SANT-like DNA-binding domain [Popillia japonica]|uniref:Regulatory protein zeste n=1 Tax=Popillia japonica TaxID=7064 RepID=A0AAW1IBT3_POPJA
MSESVSNSQTKKRKRTRNTTSDQYLIYLQYMEEDYNFRSGTINPSLGDNYIEKKWDELATALNTIGDGPRRVEEKIYRLEVFCENKI